MIRLIDLLKLQGAALENETFKIHLATIRRLSSGYI